MPPPRVGTIGDVPVHPAPRGSVLTREIAPGTVGVVLRRILWGIVAVMGFALATATIPMLWGWHPVMGHSMEPTLPYLGGYFHLQPVADPAKDLRVNDLVAVRGSALGYAIKRVAKVSPSRGIYVLGDNTDRSADSSFGANKADPAHQTWVPFTQVLGRADDLWSPQRALRARTAQGRLENRVELLHNPQKTLWNDDGTVAAVEGGSEIAVISVQGEVRVPGRYPSWESGRLRYVAQTKETARVIKWTPGGSRVVEGVFRRATHDDVCTGFPTITHAWVNTTNPWSLLILDEASPEITAIGVIKTVSLAARTDKGELIVYAHPRFGETEGRTGLPADGRQIGFGSMRTSGVRIEITGSQGAVVSIDHLNLG